MFIERSMRKLARLVRRNHLQLWYYRRFKSGERFQIGERKFDYFYHRRNATWVNERAIEIPIVWSYVLQFSGRRVLEVGNVLSHYFRTNHDVVDKYEKKKHVINEDIIEFSPRGGYDLIVSISTLEHVGWDETPRDADKIPVVVDRLRQLLNPGGTLVMTAPLGYNDYLDDHLRNGRIRFAEQRYLKRFSPNNRWREVAWEDAAATSFDRFHVHANAMMVGVDQAA